MSRKEQTEEVRGRSYESEQELAQATLELRIQLPQPPKDGDQRRVPPTRPGRWHSHLARHCLIVVLILS